MMDDRTPVSDELSAAVAEDLETFDSARAEEESAAALSAGFPEGTREGNAQKGGPSSGLLSF